MSGDEMKLTGRGLQKALAEKDCLILSKEKTLQEISEHALRLERASKEKDDLIMSLQKSVNEISDWSITGGDLQKALAEKDRLILSKEKALQEVSEHALRLEQTFAEKDALIISLQKSVNEMSDWSSNLSKELGDTRGYFNQVWREYSSMRNKFHQLRMHWLVGWFVDRERFLPPGEKLLRKLAREQRLVALEENVKHEQFKEIFGDTGCYSGSPHTVILDVTAQCNLRCVMCFQSSMEKRDFVFGEMTDKCINNSAQFIAKADEVKLFATGEPFLSSGLRGIIDLLHGNVAEIIVSTNGTIYNNNVDYILDRLTMLTISFDSASKDRFEKIRKNSKFYHIVNNIKRMRVRHPSLPMAFAVTVARYNLNECPEIIRFALDLKINHVQFSRMRSLEAGMDVEELQEPDREWIDSVEALVREASKQTGVTVEWQV